MNKYRAYINALIYDPTLCKFPSARLTDMSTHAITRGNTRVKIHVHASYFRPNYVIVVFVLTLNQH